MLSFTATYHPSSGLCSTSASGLSFAFIDPKATYWQRIFPDQVIFVLGIDFSIACGALSIAKIAKSHEPSVVAALFQMITTLGVSSRLAIAHFAGMYSQARKLGVTVVAKALVILGPRRRLNKNRA
jgi:hypothetical protein